MLINEGKMLSVGIDTSKYLVNNSRIVLVIN